MRGTPETVNKLLAVTMSAGLLLSGQDARLGDDTIGHCYSVPQPDPAEYGEMSGTDDPDTPEEQARYDATRLPLRIPLPVTIDEQGRAEGEPDAPDEESRRRIAAGIVRITINQHERIDGTVGYGSKASGFITRDEQGNQLAVTAAHAVMGKAGRQITVTTDDGHSASVSGGCYMYELGGIMLQRPDTSSSVPDTDVAVLRLTAPLPVEPMELRAAAPTPLEWTTAANYQLKQEPGSPAIYQALITRVPPSADLVAVSGLHAVDSPWPNLMARETRASPGSSGGPLLDGADRVVGITIGSTDAAERASEDELARQANIRLTGPGYDYYFRGFLHPNVVAVTGVPAIQAAMRSPRSR